MDDFCGGEPVWNDSYFTNTSWPQFTDCFQQTLLVWVPCGWLWITSPLYIYYLCSLKDGITHPVNLLNTLKTFFSLFLCLLSVIEIIKTAGDEKKSAVPDSLYVSNAIQAATFLFATFIIQLERFKGLITSGILFIFWLLTFVASIIPFYSKIFQEEYDTDVFRFSLFYIYFTFVFIELILSCFAEKLHRNGYHVLGLKASPEQSASFLNRLVFHWINPLIFTGYKKSLVEDDLFELHPRDQSSNFVPYFYKKWTNELEKVRKLNEIIKRKANTSVQFSMNGGGQIQSSHSEDTERTPLLPAKEVEIKGGRDNGPKLKDASLLKVLAITYGPTLLKAHACKFIYDLLQFVSPTLLNVLIAYTSNHATEPEWKGYVYASSFFVVAIVQSAFFHQNFHIGMTLGMRVKSSVISAIYRKAMTIDSEARKASTAGEIVNLMSVDAQRLQDITGYLWMMWSAPLQIILAMYLLWGTLGPSVLAGLGVMILLMPINGVIAAKLRKFQMAQMKLKDKRIKLMSEVLNGMKVLKLYAWELSFQEKISEIRNQELDILRKSAYLNAFGTFTWTCAPFLVTLATFATYVLSSTENYLDAQKAFVALSLFNILRFPMTLLPMLLSFIVQANVSIGRIGKFLRHGDLDTDNVSKDSSYADVIHVEDGTFTWDKTATKPTLRNINLRVPHGKLVAVVGQVGAGKSSIVSAILGEMEKLKGKVNVKGSTAYVPQEAWIQNATVTDNILFGSGMNNKRYDDILDACALKPDLEILPGGDQTEIGEKGINLSGGQKQRVSLARAVYSNTDIYLLDDPLSAVDSHVGKHIFEKVIGEKGLLKDKTRILVTHGVHWLPMVDNIVVVIDGEISEVGSYDELLSHNGAFAQFLKTYLTEGAESEEDEDPDIQQIKSKILERVDSVTSDGATSADEKERKRKLSLTKSPEKLIRQRSRISETIPEIPKDKIPKEGERLILDEKSETGKVHLSVFVDYIRAVGFLAAFFIILLYALYQAASVYSSVWLKDWTADPLLANRSIANTTKYQDKNALYLGVYGALGVGQAIFVLAYALIASVRFIRAAGELHFRMLANILRSPMSFFDTTPVGRIVNRFSRDVETVDNNLPSLFRSWLNTVSGVLSTLIVISYSTPLFLVLVIPLGILYWLIQRFYVPTSRQLKRLESTTRSPIYTHFGETIAGASTVRAYGCTQRFIDESQSRVDKNLVFYFAGIASNRWLGFRLEFLGSLVVLAAAMFAVVSNDSGIVGLSVSYALQVTGSLNWMVRMTSDLETNIVSVERMKEYSETPTEAAWILPFRRPPAGWPGQGAVNFVNYMTRYRPGLDLVLKGISCELLPGQKVGIVGRTGAGKSSLTVALFRLIESAGGSIVIDGQKISDMGLHDLRSKLTILPQDPVLFSGSLRMNLDPFDKHTDEELWVALEHAHLRKFVSEVPEKLEYECGEGGHNLSVGQRQLVCLARTLLRKTKILVLDEATAAVDMETDDLIQQTIRTEFKDCTVLTIAHRLNTIMDYDRIIVLDQGNIKEFDAPTTLLQNKNSSFYSMAKDAGLV
ncbi:multidrug resistance-associated protein 1 [Patella vulgata]|uniref:multidrug resistance-associated protein 1 n=1 Tax=Patella vulgata TaxID=6465 RepID=UPI0024A83528|nr:multidrug resistance-associated protein 1 [Patella vulgata]